jgi:hypothetical protein
VLLTKLPPQRWIIVTLGVRAIAKTRQRVNATPRRIAAAARDGNARQMGLTRIRIPLRARSAVIFFDIAAGTPGGFQKKGSVFDLIE